MVSEDVLIKSLHSWWKEQFKLANIQKEVDPSLPENIFESFDGIAYDFGKLWVRSNNRDHILWIEKPSNGIRFFEFIPFSNMIMFPSDYKGNPIRYDKILEDFLEENWQGSEFFTLPYDIKIETAFFRDVEYCGIRISNFARRAFTEEGFKREFLEDWRKNVFRNIRPFCEKYLYNDDHNDSGPKKLSQNPHWPYRPSIENGFVKFLTKPI